MNAKVVNYTPEQTEQIVAGYKAGEAVETLALAVGKSARSVVAKLSREGVYTKAPKAGAGNKVTKVDLINQIATKYGVKAEVLASLEKATREALAILVG